MSAPTTQDQVGIIASCVSSSQAQSLASDQGIQFRIINAKRKMIEFIGISKKDLSLLLPRSKFKKNKIYYDIFNSESFSDQNIENQEYYGAHPPVYANESTPRFFPHLKQIQALNPEVSGEGVTIAIIDTGVYYNHPHLSPNIKTNPLDKNAGQGNRVDDDNNGYIDDYIGWDFYNGDSYPVDDNGHGTHVAGLAASTYMGVAPKAKILPIKVLGADGSGDLGTIAAGILYAIDMGADIINLSLGGSGGEEITNQVQSIISSVEIAKRNNSLIIAAAGNGGSDTIGDCNDKLPIYPANIQADNLISIASVNVYNELTEYSNFGVNTVHIAAPGGDYLGGGLNSTGIPNCQGPCEDDQITYRSSMGTSMATPIVSGLAALIKSKKLSLDYKGVVRAILNNGTKLNALKGLVQSESVIDVARSLRSIKH